MENTEIKKVTEIATWQGLRCLPAVAVEAFEGQTLDAET